MYIKYLKCYMCDKTYSSDNLKYRCACGGGLDIIYDLERLRRVVSWDKFRKRQFNHWRYEELYPALKNKVTFGEGGTPLVSCRENHNVMLKLEGCNPTGSFKDRGSTIELSHALDEGATHIVCASTGNMGASVSSYSARAGLQCEVVIPHDASGEKIAQIKQHGAKVTHVRGDYSKAAEVAFNKYKVEHDFLVGDYAYRGEGEKSVGFEIMDQLQGYKLDYIIVPIGNGTLLSGIWKGMKEMYYLGLIDKLPKLIGVQAAGCKPVVTAFEKNLKEIDSVIPNTIAGAVACGDPLDGIPALRALRESKGDAVSITDTELKHARTIMAHMEGVDAELSGVLSFAAYHKLKIPKQKRCVLIVTGNGLKDLSNL